MPLNKLSEESQNDYRGLSVLMGFNDFQEFSEYPNPVDKLITKWVRRSTDAKFSDVISFVKKLERYDICDGLARLISMTNYAKISTKVSLKLSHTLRSSFFVIALE